MSVWNWIGGAAVLTAIAAAGFVVAVRMTSDAALAGVDPATVTPPSSPNWTLAATSGLATAVEPGLVAPRFPGTPEETLALFLEVAQAQPRVTLSPAGADPLCRTLVQRSALIGYPDVVSVCARPLDGVDGGSGLIVYSRSIWGRSDLGVNAARVSLWLDEVAAQAQITN